MYVHTYMLCHMYVRMFVFVHTCREINNLIEKYVCEYLYRSKITV